MKRLDRALQLVARIVLRNEGRMKLSDVGYNNAVTELETIINTLQTRRRERMGRRVDQMLIAGVPDAEPGSGGEA